MAENRSQPVGILIVDDEEIILRLGARVLAREGFDIAATSDTQEALSFLTEDPERFRMAILDVVMPNENGIELAEKLRNVRPDLLVLFSSGYSPDGELERLVDGVSTEFISKPFTGDDIAEKVKGMLAG